MGHTLRSWVVSRRRLLLFVRPYKRGSRSPRCSSRSRRRRRDCHTSTHEAMKVNELCDESIRGQRSNLGECSSCPPLLRVKRNESSWVHLPGIWPGHSPMKAASWSSCRGLSSLAVAFTQRGSILSFDCHPCLTPSLRPYSARMAIHILVMRVLAMLMYSMAAGAACRVATHNH